MTRIGSRIDYSAGSSASSLMAEIFYDIAGGDLDVAILDAAGHILKQRWDGGRQRLHRRRHRERHLLRGR